MPRRDRTENCDFIIRDSEILELLRNPKEAFASPLEMADFLTAEKAVASVPILISHRKPVEEVAISLRFQMICKTQDVLHTFRGGRLI